MLQMATSSVMQQLNWKTSPDIISRERDPQQCPTEPCTVALRPSAAPGWPRHMGQPFPGTVGCKPDTLQPESAALCSGICLAKVSRGRSAHPCVA